MCSSIVQHLRPVANETPYSALMLFWECGGRLYYAGQIGYESRPPTRRALDRACAAGPWRNGQRSLKRFQPLRRILRFSGGNRFTKSLSCSKVRCLAFK